MPKSTLKQKLKRINDEQEREIEKLKKEIAERYKPLREAVFEECKNNKHKYDNGTSAEWSHRNSSKYCSICGQTI